MPSDRISLDSQKIVDLGSRTPLFPFENGVYVEDVLKVYLHDTTKNEKGEFNQYGSKSYRARIWVKESNNPLIRVGSSYELMFGVFDKGFKGEKAAGLLRQLLGAMAGEAGKQAFKSEEYLQMVLDQDLENVSVVHTRRSGSPRTYKNDKGVEETKSFSEDLFQSA